MLTTAFFIRAALSGIIVAIIALVSRRYPGLGGLIASLPLISVLGMVWLWHDTGDREAVATYLQSAFWYFIPTIPMFIFMPMMLRHGISFWLTLTVGIVVTLLLYLAMNRALAHYGITL